MKTSPQEYKSLTASLTNPNEFAHLIRIPDDEPIYEIDLNKREITIPEFLSVEDDHNSEIIWFKTDRFFDNFDLYDCNCWIQYINANKEKHYYGAPILVGASQFGNEQILIPWAISEEVSKKSGTIQFSFQFFKLTEDGNEFVFRLNTKPASGKILTGLKVDPVKDLANRTITEDEAKALDDKLHSLHEAYNTLSGKYVLYWTEADQLS